MLRFHYVEISKRRRDLPTSQGERASTEHAGHLTIYRQSRQQEVWGKGQTIRLFPFFEHRQGLCNSRQTLILGQSIQSLVGSLYLVLPPQKLHEFHCDTLSTSNRASVTARLLNRPWLISLVAKASTESNSINIFMMISVTGTISVGGIVV